MKPIGIGQFRLGFVDLTCGAVKTNQPFFEHSKYAKIFYMVF